MRETALADTIVFLPDALADEAERVRIETIDDPGYRPPTLAEIVAWGVRHRHLSTTAPPPGMAGHHTEVTLDGTSYFAFTPDDEFPEEAIAKGVIRFPSIKDHRNRLVRRLKSRRGRFYRRKYHPKRKRWQ